MNRAISVVPRRATVEHTICENMWRKRQMPLKKKRMEKSRVKRVKTSLDLADSSIIIVLVV